MQNRWKAKTTREQKDTGKKIQSRLLM